MDQLTSAGALGTRETDLIGWSSERAILGIISTEVTVQRKERVTEVLITKIDAGLQNHLGMSLAAKGIVEFMSPSDGKPKTFIGSGTYFARSIPTVTRDVMFTKPKKEKK